MGTPNPSMYPCINFWGKVLGNTIARYNIFQLELNQIAKGQKAEQKVSA
jgi:hypothetical protein